MATEPKWRAVAAQLRACAEGRAGQWGGVGEPNYLEEVMRVDPEEGIVDLGAHLDRLKTEADVRGFAFDRHDARNELQAATFGKRHPVIARLVLSPTGAMAIEVTSA